MSPVRRQSVLVVDDEEVIVELVSEYLRTRGMAVRTAGDGDAALTALTQGDIDVVLTDLRLPVRGGMSLLESIVAQELPVATVVMTGYGTVETATQALKLGATDYLLKPVRLRDVYGALVQAIASRSDALEGSHARLRSDLYEGLLGLGSGRSQDDLVACFAAVVCLETGSESCRVGAQSGAGWSPLLSGAPPLPTEEPTARSAGPAGLALWLSGTAEDVGADENVRLVALLAHLQRALRLS